MRVSYIYEDSLAERPALPAVPKALPFDKVDLRLAGVTYVKRFVHFSLRRSSSCMQVSMMEIVTAVTMEPSSDFDDVWNDAGMGSVCQYLLQKVEKLHPCPEYVSQVVSQLPWERFFNEPC